jgi:predicted metal-dependent peptidase
MHALFAVTPLAMPGYGTFGVDRDWRLYMDPALLTGPDAWTPVAAGWVLLHEVGHLLRDHAARYTMLPRPQIRLAWNLATDAAINDDLIAARAALPGEPVTPAALGLPDRGVEEDYYAELLRDLESLDGFDDGGDGCGSGAGGPGLPGELPPDATLDGQPVSSIGPAEGDMIRRQVAQDIKACQQGKGRGTVPAGLDRWADDVLRPPVVPWPQVLRAAVSAALANRAGRTDYTYSRPSRRRVPRIVKPAMRGPTVRVSIVVDTSGSMSQDDLTAALSEIDGVLRSSGVARDQLRVLSCDAATGTPARVSTVRDIRLTGGGGTDMRVGIAAAARTRPVPDVIIVLSDGDTPWPDRPGKARLVCAIISPRQPKGTPEWAVTVHVPTAA